MRFPTDLGQATLRRPARLRPCPSFGERLDEPRPALEESDQTFFAEFLGLIDAESAPRLRAGEAIFLDKEDFTDWPSGDRREMDLVAKVPVEGQELPLLVHVEIETDVRSGMDHRLWQYYMQLQLRHDYRSCRSWSICAGVDRGSTVGLCVRSSTGR